jgi:hypothetical protein
VADADTPGGGRDTAHLGFLNYALKHLGSSSVMVAVSDYNIMNDGGWGFGNPDPDAAYAFTSGPQAMRTQLEWFLSSLVDPATGKVHAAVHSIQVGNEIDLTVSNGLTQNDGQKTEFTSRAQRTLWWVKNLHQRIAERGLVEEGRTVGLTSAFSAADIGAAPPNATQPYSHGYGSNFTMMIDGAEKGAPVPLGTVFAAGVNSQTAPWGTFQRSFDGVRDFGADWYKDWWFNSYNLLYQNPTGVAQYLGQYETGGSSAPQSKENPWPFQWPNNGKPYGVPLLITEMGRSRDTDAEAARRDLNLTQSGQDRQFGFVLEEATGIENHISKTPNSMVMGYAVFEYTDEPDNVKSGVESVWGIMMQAPTQAAVLPQYPAPVPTPPLVPTGTTQIAYEPYGPGNGNTWASTDYPVVTLYPVTHSQQGSILEALENLFRAHPEASPQQ